MKTEKKKKEKKYLIGFWLKAFAVFFRLYGTLTSFIVKRKEDGVSFNLKYCIILVVLRDVEAILINTALCQKVTYLSKYNCFLSNDFKKVLNVLSTQCFSM